MSIAWATTRSENIASIWLLEHLLDKVSLEEFNDIAAVNDMARDEDEDTNISDDGIHRRVCPESIHDTGNNKSYQPHEENTSKAGEILLRCSTENAHRTKGQGRSCKRLSNSPYLISKEDDR